MQIPDMKSSWPLSFSRFFTPSSSIDIACRERALFHAAWPFRVLFPKFNGNAAIVESALLQMHPAPSALPSNSAAIVNTLRDVSAVERYKNHCSAMRVCQVDTECPLVRAFLNV